MKFFQGKGSLKREDLKPEEFDLITKVIGPYMDKAALGVFQRHREKLVRMPITYIVPAVWGAVKSGTLDDAQNAMHAGIRPFIEKVDELVDRDTLSAPQRFAFQYLVRSLFITKISFIIQSFKNLTYETEYCGRIETEFLENAEPAGHA